MDAKSISNPARHHESLRAEQIRADANRLRIQQAAGVDRESAVPCMVPAQGVEALRLEAIGDIAHRHLFPLAGCDPRDDSIQATRKCQQAN